MLLQVGAWKFDQKNDGSLRRISKMKDDNAHAYREQERENIPLKIYCELVICFWTNILVLCKLLISHCGTGQNLPFNLCVQLPVEYRPIFFVVASQKPFELITRFLQHSSRTGVEMEYVGGDSN